MLNPLLYCIFWGALSGALQTQYSCLLFQVLLKLLIKSVPFVRLECESYLSRRELFQNIYYLGSKLDILIHSRRGPEDRAAGGEWVGILNDQAAKNYFEIRYWGRIIVTIYVSDLSPKEETLHPMWEIRKITSCYFSHIFKVILKQKSSLSNSCHRTCARHNYR